MTILEDIQENIRYRVQSARAMVMGGSNRQSASPIQRRRKIMEKNRELLMGAAPTLGMSGDKGSEASVDNVRTTRRSARERQDGAENRTREGRRSTTGGESYVGSKIKDMSSVEKGTAQRAADRSFN